MADGNWVFGAVIDAADGAQADAMEQIAGGKAGGVPGMICGGVVSDHRGVMRAPIAIKAEGLSRSVDIPGVLAFSVDGVQPRANPGEAMHIDNTSHPANKRLALARAKEMRVSAFGVNETILGQGNNGHFAPFDWKG